MPVKYIYLDDEPPAEVRGYVREVEGATTGLSITHYSPKSYPQQVPFLRKQERTGELDGLILDLRLDEFPDWEVEDGKKAEYRAATLAQEIRTRATERLIGEYPIVLWSTDERLRRSYTRDDTSHDLFDYKVIKGDIEDVDRAALIAIRLKSLVDGYREIRAIRSTLRAGNDRVFRFLGFTKQPEFFDERISSVFAMREGPIPAHEYSRFILRELLESPGPLIDKRILSARLGIDVDRSPDFGKLVVKLFGGAEYKGPFREGWPRWWAALVDEIWYGLKGAPGALRSTAAKDRVMFLRSRSRLKGLEHAVPLQDHYSTKYWTICCATGRPLDPRDGYLLDQQPHYPWQDRLYVSLEAELTGVLRQKHLRIDPLEYARVQRAKEKVM
jgi:hypothetical protein